MKQVKVYYLGSCDTCQKILKEWNLGADAVLQDIKTEKITEAQLDEMAALAGGYEPLFSRRALKYKALGLAQLKLEEADYRRYILEEYTFLKRPVAVLGNEIFVGNANAVVEAAKAALSK